MQNPKQILMKSEIFLRKYGPFVLEPGMWWNLEMFGKFSFGIFLVRVDCWYLWKTIFLNFRDFQESPNPLKIPMPTPVGPESSVELFCFDLSLELFDLFGPRGLLVFMDNPFFEL